MISQTSFHFSATDLNFAQALNINNFLSPKNLFGSMLVHFSLDIDCSKVVGTIFDEVTKPELIVVNG